jgi:hypothetical protein
MKWVYCTILVIVLFLVWWSFTTFSIFNMFFGQFNSVVKTGNSMMHENQNEFAERRCRSDLDFSMGKATGLLYDENAVRTALDACMDLKTKPPSVKKAIARAEVCVGNYNAAENYINQYPADLGYLRAIIAAKKTNPESYTCLSPTKKNDFRGGDPFYRFRDR